MKITPEMMAKFEQCQSADEVMELAKRENVTITMDQARKAFDLFNSEDLTDEMMEKISGGGFWRCGAHNKYSCRNKIKSLQRL